MDTKSSLPLKTGGILAGIMLSLFLAAVDNTIVGTAMPRIITEFSGMDRYSWPFTAYLLCATAIVPIAGKLSDMLGRKLVVLSGMAVFLTGSVLCGLSGNMEMLSVFRALQGIGGGILISSAFILVAEIFPFRERGKTIGIVASMFGLASLLGPVLGGVLTHWLTWRSVFFVNLPLGIIAVYLIGKNLPLLKHPENQKRFDLAGMVFFLTAVIPLILAFVEAGRSFQWFSFLQMILFLVSVLSFLVFIRIELRIHPDKVSPLLPMDLFRNKVFRVSVLLAFLIYAGMFGILFFIPLLAQKGLGMNAASSGLLLLPMSLAMMIGGNLGGILVGKTRNFKGISLMGFMLATVGSILLAVMGNQANALQIMAGVFFAGLGIGMVLPVYNMASQAVFPLKEIGIVTAMLEFFQNMGGVIASSLLGALEAYRAASGFSVALSVQPVFICCTGILVIGLTSALFLNTKTIQAGMEKQAKQQKSFETMGITEAQENVVL